MYRQYEDPRALQKQYDEMAERYHYLKSIGALDVEDEIDFQLSLDELHDRINFAWQDEEYDMSYSD